MMGDNLQQGLFCQALKCLPQRGASPAITIDQAGFGDRQSRLDLQGQDQLAELFFDTITLPYG